MIMHVDESELGTLDTGKVKPYKDGVEIHGVKIPHDIVRQLRKDGRSLESFTRGELLDALQAAAIDGKVFDDPHGMNFRDRLHLTPEEERKRAHEKDDHRFCDAQDKEEHRRTEHAKGDHSFCDRLEEEREHAHDAHLHDYSHN